MDEEAYNLDPQEWPTALILEGEMPSLKLKHLKFSRSPASDGYERLSGFVVWSGKGSDDGKVGVRWDWSEVEKDVLAITNPLKIRTNIEIVDGVGYAIPARLAILRLNVLVNVLEWQDKVLSEIEQIGRSKGVAPPGPPQQTN